MLFALVLREVPRDALPTMRGGLRRYLVLLLGTGCLGVVSGTIEVALPSIAIAAHHPGLAGALVVVATLGTLLGAVVAMRGRRPASATDQPAPRSSRTTDRPMPEPAPVTTAIFVCSASMAPQTR